MSRVLVTGSAGFVGWHVTRAFTDAGWQVDGLDMDGDFPSDAVDVIVSLAATADPAEAVMDPAGAYANSTRIMLETLEYARSTGARVLHVSTNEAHPPVGPYGGAKACQEVICKTYPDVPVTIVVTQSLFGERQQPNKLVPTAIRNILAGESVPLQRSGTKYAMRPFLYVGDLARALVALATVESPPKRVHLGAEEMLSVDSIVHVLGRAFGMIPKIQPVQAGDRPGHEVTVKPIGWDFDGWRPHVPMSYTLWTVANWYRSNPKWLESSYAYAQWLDWREAST